jgi:branched-chain amino acid transport system permease protein
LDTKLKKWLVVAFIVAIFAIPLNVGNQYVLTVLNTAAIAAIAAAGLNLLTGYAGQLFFGHSFFVGVGAFLAQYFGGILGLPFVVWLPLTIVATGAVGALTAPFALRLKGPYLAIVSLGLVFLGIYVWQNVPALGGNNGTTVSAPIAIGPVDFSSLRIGPFALSREQSLFILFYAIMGLATLVLANIVRTRSGRAMQAVRDHDLAAEVLGINMLRTLTNAFVGSSLFAGLAGGLLAVNLQFIVPNNFDIPLAFEYVAIIVIGGLASVWGSVLGALFVGLIPVIATFLAGYLPFIWKPGDYRGITTSGFSLIIYGILIVIFLLYRREGLISLFRHRGSR